MDARVAGKLKELQRGVMDEDLVRYANRLGMGLTTLQLVLAHLLAQTPFVEVSQATGVNQRRLNRLIYYRWENHISLPVQKKSRGPELRSGDPTPISAAHLAAIDELRKMRVRPRDIREYLKINWTSWQMAFPNS